MVRNIIGIIVPVYNEQDSLYRLKHELDQFLATNKVDAGVLFVDDGSDDQSLQRIEVICSDNDRYSFISLERNMGLSAALKAGIDHVDSRWIGYIDADLQTSPADFVKLFPYMNDYDLVLGHRYNRRDTLIKRLSSGIANTFRRKVLRDGVRDTGCPLKILKAEMARLIPLFDGMHRFLPALVQALGGKVIEVPVEHYPRQEGQSKYKLANRIINPFLDTLAVYWMKKRMIHYRLAKKKSDD